VGLGRKRDKADSVSGNCGYEFANDRYTSSALDRSDHT
jgi:hypothetical protein